MGGCWMEGGDFSRDMGQAEDPKINVGGHFIHSGVGSHSMGGGQFIYLIMRGPYYR